LEVTLMTTRKEEKGFLDALLRWLIGGVETWD